MKGSEKKNPTLVIAFRSRTPLGVTMSWCLPDGKRGHRRSPVRLGKFSTTNLICWTTSEICITRLPHFVILAFMRICEVSRGLNWYYRLSLSPSYMPLQVTYWNARATTILHLSRNEITLVSCNPNGRAPQDTADDFIQLRSILNLVRNYIACEVMGTGYNSTARVRTFCWWKKPPYRCVSWTRQYSSSALYISIFWHGSRGHDKNRTRIGIYLIST